jgi:hypothetical protein
MGIRIRVNDSDAGGSEQKAEAKEEELWERYIRAMQPLFFPEKPTEPDIMQLFSALLRTGGMEDAGWDPYGESKLLLDDLLALMKVTLPDTKFSEPEKTAWRLALLFYNHIIEMSAPYEVLLNLLRYRLNKGFALNPFYDFLNSDERKRATKLGLYPKQKIKVIKLLSKEAGLDVGDIFDEFVNHDLRNAISHSDFVLTDEELRIRGQTIGGSVVFTLQDIDDLITRARVFIGSFFYLERQARGSFGQMAGRGYGYDPVYKGIMEVLTDEDALMNGFKVHWPNGSDSYYRRTPDGINMTNCILSAKQPAIELFVGMYAQTPDTFSPLVEKGMAPTYSTLENGKTLKWTD